MNRHTWLDQRRARSSPATTSRHPCTTTTATPTRRNKIGWHGCCAPARGRQDLGCACGTGRYFSMVAAAGRRVVGADQSAAMLARARGIAVALDLARLQELPYMGEYDAVLTIDAMENVPPEDWPLVLANLHRAARPGGLFT